RQTAAEERVERRERRGEDFVATAGLDRPHQLAPVDDLRRRGPGERGAEPANLLALAGEDGRGRGNEPRALYRLWSSRQIGRFLRRFRVEKRERSVETASGSSHGGVATGATVR